MATYDDFELEFVRGGVQRFLLTVTVRDEDGAAVTDATLTGWKFWLTGKSDRFKSDALAELQVSSDGGQIEIADAVARTVRITLSPADYARMKAGQDYNLFTDVKGHDVLGSGEKAILTSGHLIAKAETTRT